MESSSSAVRAWAHSIPIACVYVRCAGLLCVCAPQAPGGGGAPRNNANTRTIMLRLLLALRRRVAGQGARDLLIDGLQQVFGHLQLRLQPARHCFVLLALSLSLVAPSVIRRTRHAIEESRDI